MRPQALNGRIAQLTAIIATIVAANVGISKDGVIAPPGGGQRLREGTQLIEVTGKFEAAGDRASFVIADSSESVRVLENLALQRVMRVLPQIQPGTQWTISGMVTEYNNGNYLLLTRAIQAGRPASKESTTASGIGTRVPVDYSKTNQEKPGAKIQEPTNVSHP